MQTVMPPPRRERSRAAAAWVSEICETTSCMSRCMRLAVLSSSSPAAVRVTPRAAAVQEQAAELLLQELDLAADRGLRDVQPLGGPGEGALFGHRPEHLQLADVHVMLSITMRWPCRSVRIVELCAERRSHEAD